MYLSFDQLPPEIYSSTLDQLRPRHLQHTTYNLIRAIPRSPVPSYHLFKHLRLNATRKVILLHSIIRSNPNVATLVQSLSMEDWSADPDVVLNFIRTLKDFRSFELFVGPTYAPEHLQELFDSPFGRLEYISLRFRP